jgi:hypothetical protein
MDRPAVRAFLYVALLTGLFATSSWAGQGRFVLSGWPSICRVQISLGNFQDSNQNPVVFDGDAPSGFTYAGADGARLCYRRSLDP